MGSEIQAVLFNQQRSTKNSGNLQECNGNIRTGVDESDFPLVVLTLGGREAVSSAIVRRVPDFEVLRKTKVGAIGTSLIPALDSSSDRVEDDGEVQCFGMAPSVSDLGTKVPTISLVDVGKRLEEVRRLGNQGTLAEHFEISCELGLLCEFFYISQKLFTWNA
jgi:hypothetical protein